MEDRIEIFWQGLRNYEDSVKYAIHAELLERNTIADGITVYIQSYFEPLSAVFRNEGMAISASRQIEHFPLVDEIVARKPSDFPFKIHALSPGISDEKYRECEAGSDEVIRLFDMELQLSKVMCNIRKDPEFPEALMLSIFVPTLAEDDPKKNIYIQVYYVTAMVQVLGERLASTYFSTLHLVPFDEMENDVEMIPLYTIGDRSE